MTKEEFGGRKCSDENELRASVPEVSVWSVGPQVRVSVNFHWVRVKVTVRHVRWDCDMIGREAGRYDR